MSANSTPLVAACTSSVRASSPGSQAGKCRVCTKGRSASGGGWSIGPVSVTLAAATNRPPADATALKPAPRPRGGPARPTGKLRVSHTEPNSLGMP